MVELRLGNPLFSGGQPCHRCASKKYRRVPLLDVYGHHATVCPVSEGSTRRHNTLRDDVITLLTHKAFFLSVQREWTFPQDDDKAPASRRRLDFYTHDPAFDPSPQGFDVTVISPHSQPYVTSARTKGYALVSAEDSKIQKYGDLCTERGITLRPMAIDVYGATGPGFGTAADMISAYLSSKRGTSPATERRQLITQLSSLVLQQTAVSVNRRRLTPQAVDG